VRRVVDRFRVVPAAYVVLLRGDTQGAGEVLLQRRQDTGFMDGLWACGAAGHVEAGESVLEAAVREAAEELGVRIAPADLEPLTSMHRTGANGRAIDERVDWFLAARRWEGEPALQESKASDLVWHRFDALPADVVPHERAVLEWLRDGTLAAISTYGFDPAEAAAQAAANGE
jgi:8-oxo-dGTP diphosphatase